MKKKFVSDSFEVPKKYSTEKFIFEILSPKVAEIDYDAVMSSRERLRQVFAVKTDWPKDDMKLEDNIRDLERHEKEFYSREAFAYTVLDPSKTKCIGCAYIEPSQNEKYDCEIYCWVRNSAIKLDSELYSTLYKWLKKDWPFKNFIFPGRDIPWKDWEFTRSKNN